MEVRSVPVDTTTELAGRRALITGAASGIGAACARALAGAGAGVIAADLDGPGAAALAGEVGGEPWAVDLTDVTALDELRLDVDVLVNNAGIQHVAPIEEFPPEMFRRIQQLMVEAPFLLARAALPHMYQQGFGRIINISSVHGLRASPFKAAYVAAKHGLEGLSKVIALEGADQARVHGIPEDEVLESVILAESAVKRLVEPAEVASLVRWLAGPQAGMATGASFSLDGGWTAK